MQTIAVPLEDAVYAKAQQKALALETSVPEVVANYLRSWTSDTAALSEAHETLRARFAKRDWDFAVGTPDDRSQRNARR